MFAFTISMALFSVHMNEVSSMILQPLQKEEVNVTQWDKIPPKQVMHLAFGGTGIVTAIDGISVTIRPIPIAPSSEEPNSNVQNRNTPLFKKFGAKPVRVYFVGDLREGKSPDVVSLWYLRNKPNLRRSRILLDCKYRPKDVKVGDYISLERLAIYDGTIPVVGGMRIDRRPGGTVPPIPGWKPEPNRDRVNQLGYHEQINLVNEHEARGLPTPTNDDYLRRYLPQVWAKLQQERPVFKIPFFKK